MTPRKAQAPRGAGVRSDGEVTKGNIQTPNAGQPNGSKPRGAVTRSLARAGAGAPEMAGEATALESAAANTPPAPPGPRPHAVAARTAAENAGLINAKGQLSHPNVTPLFGPTQKPWEPVTAGAPLDSSPTNPMAMPQVGSSGIPIATLLDQVADASGSPTIRALADRAQAVAGTNAPNPFAGGAPAAP
jgi:hypothetical protein